MIDILQIRRFDIVMEELDPNLIDDNENDEQEFKLLTIEEEKDEKERGFNCLWDEFDDNDDEIQCLLNVIPNGDGTMPDYCPRHTEEHKNWMELLELYVNDILKLCEPVLIKKMNKEQTGWKKVVEEELGMTRYLISKFVNEKYKDGLLGKPIAELLDKLEE